MSPPFAIPLPAAWKPVPSEPPDVSATPQARLLAWEAYELADIGRATVGCFGFDLPGYTDELAPIVFERTEPFAVRAAGGLAPGTLLRSAWSTRGPERRAPLRFETHDGKPVYGALAFGFSGPELHTCFAVCRADRPAAIAACAEAIEHAAFVQPLAEPPSPSWSQSLALGVLAHPRPAALGFGLAIVLCIAVLLFTRGARA